jgi:hypothetical protein
MRSEPEIATLLARHEQDMASALEREQRYSQGPHTDREKASDAAREHLESEATA